MDGINAQMHVDEPNYPGASTGYGKSPIDFKGGSSYPDSPQSRRAAEPQSRRAAEPQSRRAAEPQSRRAAEPQSRRAAEPQSRRAAEPQSRRAAEPQSREYVMASAMVPGTVRATV